MCGMDIHAVLNTIPSSGYDSVSTQNALIRSRTNIKFLTGTLKSKIEKFPMDFLRSTKLAAGK